MSALSGGDRAAADPQLVRRVDPSEGRRVAFAAALALGLTTGAILLHLIVPPHEWRYLYVGLPLSAWCFALALTWLPRPKVVRLADLTRELRGFVPPSLSIARAARGFSIAVGSGAGEAASGVFLEVEREDEVRRVLERLGVPWPGRGVVTVRMPRPWLRGLRVALALIGGTSGLLYSLLVGVFELVDYKSMFGLPAITCALLASVVFLVEPLFRRSIVVGRDSVYTRSRGSTSASAGEHVNLHKNKPVDAGEAPTREPPDARAAMLTRSADTTRAWLTRLDALGTSGDGYRGDAFSPDELRVIVADERAPADARLGALRVLARRGDSLAPQLHDAVASDLGAARVRVVAEDTAEDAAAALEALGPAFRVRHGR